MTFKEHFKLKNLAKKHNVDISQLKSGLKEEKEHTTDFNVAAKIALDHLAEDPKYYTKLTKAGL